MAVVRHAATGSGRINSGKVFDLTLTLPLGLVAEGCRAVDERRVVKRCCVPECLSCSR